MKTPAPKTAHGALALYAIVTLLSFPHELPGGGSLDLGILLAWFGPAALIVGIRGLAPLRAMAMAFLASLVSHAVLFHWFYVVTVQYGGMPGWIGFFSPLVPALYVSLFSALFAWLWTRVATESPAPILVGAMLWVAVDWARGEFMGGFPWATLGYALHFDWPLLGWTRWAGVYVLSFFAAAVGIALARAWSIRSSASLRALVVTLFVVAIAHVMGAWISAPSREADVIVRIAAIQGNIDQGEKWNRARRDRIFERYLSMSREAIESGAQWIVWPETAVPGLIEAEPEFSIGIGDLARRFEVAFIVGGTGVEFDPGTRRFRDFFDSAFLFDSTGALRDRYDKTHLVPFGEFVPLRDLFGRFFKSLARGLSDSDIRAGEAPRALAIQRPRDRSGSMGRTEPNDKRLKVAVPICYELLFPDLVRRFGEDGAGVMLAMTNDAWYGRTGAPHQFLAMTALRAAENGRWVVRAANTGISAIIDAQGRVRQSTPLFEESILVADVPVATDAVPTIYSRVGDVFAGICVVVSIGLLGRREFMARRHPEQREHSNGPGRQEQEA
jgi:apolipoprotein N-acyltransferase